jgi:hypothetical protein
MTTQSSPSAAPRRFALINDRIITAPRLVVPVSVLRALASIPADQVLVRDHGSPNDVVLDDRASVDLNDGNVFYTRPRCEATLPAACGSPAKLAFAVDDAFELSTAAELPFEAFLGLFSLEASKQLFRDFESPNDQPMVAGSVIRFQDGPVFYTRGGGHVDKRVEITIDGVKHKVAPGNTSVAELKKIGNVPVADELIQNIAGKLTPLADDATVCIVGGEEFVSHPRCGASS